MAKSVLSRIPEQLFGLPKDLWVFSACVITALISPALLILLTLVWCGSRVASGRGRWVIGVGIATFLAFYNATKHPESDWYWYVDGYFEILRSGVRAFLDSGGLSVRVTEPIYYCLSWVISVLSEGNVPALAVVITFVIYLPYATSLERLFQKLDLDDGIALACLVSAVLAGLTFTLSLHLIRQYMAGTLLFVVYLQLLDNKYYKATLFIVFGLLVHNSFLVPGIFLLFGCLLWASGVVQRHIFKVILLLFLLGFAAGSLASRWALDSTLAQAAMKDDGGVSAIVLCIDACIFFTAFYWLWEKQRVDGVLEKETAIALLFLAVFGGLLVGARDLTLFFLRFYFYVEWFRVIGLIALCRITAKTRVGHALPLALCSLSVALIFLRIERAPWDYGGSVFDHLWGSVTWWLNHLVQS